MEYVIASECERGFWSNQLGWVTNKASASVFPSTSNYPVILRNHGDAHFIDVEIAPEFYLEEPLQSGDKVIWDEAVSAFSKVLRIESVKTSDGYARTSNDVVVLCDMSGSTTEVCTRGLLYTPLFEYTAAPL